MAFTTVTLQAHPGAKRSLVEPKFVEWSCPPGIATRVAQELFERGERRTRMLARLVGPKLKADLASVGVELLN